MREELGTEYRQRRDYLLAWPVIALSESVVRFKVASCHPGDEVLRGASKTRVERLLGKLGLLYMDVIKSGLSVSWVLRIGLTWLWIGVSCGLVCVRY